MTQKRNVEKEHSGPFWTHPYFMYGAFTLALFLFLVVMGWLALEGDWLPNRGIKP